MITHELNKLNQSNLTEKCYGFIYITTNLINEKKYIGQKKLDSGSRWKSYLGSGYHLLNAVKKYGKENFKRDIVDLAYSEEDLNKKEYEWINKYNAVYDNMFYNMIEGGNVQESLKRKNSIPIICIHNGFVFKSIADASLWSGYTITTIKNTYKKKHNLNNTDEGLVFRPLNHVKEGCGICIICGDNFIKRNNVHKKCDECAKLKGRLILNKTYKDIDEIGIEIHKLTDGWTIRKIDTYDAICHDCELGFERTKKYQRRCIECQNLKDRQLN